MAEEVVEMRVIFFGRVQGVFFRATARDIGKRMNLVGTVKNLPDGSVEVFAQGGYEQLQAYVIKISQEFYLDPNNPLKKEFYEPHQKFEEFLIVY
ncbi:MAG: Acylphosphatase [Chlamydiae bacterium]|nr:Acylphosphatase [Chlamydiota bacterium]